MERRWREKNKDAHYAMIAKWQRDNLDRRRLATKRYAAKNPAKIAVANRRYFGQRKVSMPAWANEFFMHEAYELAKLRTKLLGYKWTVDHIVPLRSPVVCGLHAHTNLRVIPLSANAAKGNRFWPDMPDNNKSFVKGAVSLPVPGLTTTS